jgi:hypothetical protein
MDIRAGKLPQQAMNATVNSVATQKQTCGRSRAGTLLRYSLIRNVTIR